MYKKIQRQKFLILYKNYTKLLSRNEASYITTMIYEILIFSIQIVETLKIIIIKLLETAKALYKANRCQSIIIMETWPLRIDKSRNESLEEIKFYIVVGQV